MSKKTPWTEPTDEEKKAAEKAAPTKKAPAKRKPKRKPPAKKSDLIPAKAVANQELTEQDLPIHKDAADFFAMSHHRNMKFDEQRALKFLEYYALTGRKGDSARAVGVAHGTVNRWEREHDFFGEMVLEAHQLHLDRLERELYRRGVEGWEEPVFAGKDGDLVGHIRKFSDKLLELALKKADPSGYGNKEAVQVNVNTGVLVAPEPDSEATTDLIIEDVIE